MKNYLRNIFKKFKILNFIRNIYNLIFKEGYIYQKFQRYFLTINLRSQIALIEKKIINLFFFQSKNFFKLKINKDNIHYNQLNNEGVTKPFCLDSVDINKENFFNYFKNQKIFYDKNPENKFYLKDKEESLEIGYFDNKDTANCPYIFDVVNDPYLVETLSTFFGCPYKLDYISAWWSFKNSSTEPRERTQYFHRDLDNFNFVKLFLYLTDVDDLSGPHQYIKFSHKKKIEKIISTKVVDFKRIKENVDNKDIYTFKGKAGSLLLENTFGLHRAKAPKNNDRLMMVMTFSLVKTPYSPKKPFLKFESIKSQTSKYNKFINKNYIVNH